MQLLWVVRYFWGDGCESGNYPAIARGCSDVVTEASGVWFMFGTGDGGSSCGSVNGAGAAHGGDCTGHVGGGHDAVGELRVTALATGSPFCCGAWAAGDVTGTWIYVATNDPGSVSRLIIIGACGDFGKVIVLLRGASASRR